MCWPNARLRLSRGVTHWKCFGDIDKLIPVSVPDFQSCMLPFLRFLSDGKDRTKREVVESIAKHFELSDADRAAQIPSGKQSLIGNRVGWARTYLSKAGLVRARRRGVLAITERGRELLATKPAAVTMKLLERYPEYQAFRVLRREKSSATEDLVDNSTADETKTPEEALHDAYAGIRADVETEILEKVQACSWQFSKGSWWISWYAWDTGAPARTPGR